MTPNLVVVVRGRSVVMTILHVVFEGHCMEIIISG